MNVLNSIIPSFPPFPTCRIPLVASFIPHLSRRLRASAVHLYAKRFTSYRIPMPSSKSLFACFA